MPKPTIFSDIAIAIVGVVLLYALVKKLQEHPDSKISPTGKYYENLENRMPSLYRTNPQAYKDAAGIWQTVIPQKSTYGVLGKFRSRESCTGIPFLNLCVEDWNIG